MHGGSTEWDFEVEVMGEPASKANSRRLVTIGGKPRFIKSAKALAYCKEFIDQCPELPVLLEKDIEVEIIMWMASRRPDLEKAILCHPEPCFQGVLWSQPEGEGPGGGLVPI